jgi:hypothetical protein
VPELHVGVTVQDGQALVIIRDAARRTLCREQAPTRDQWTALLTALRRAAGLPAGDEDKLTLWSDLGALDALAHPEASPVELDPTQAVFRWGYAQGQLPAPAGSDVLADFFECVRLLMVFWPGRWATMKVAQERIK